MSHMEEFAEIRKQTAQALMAHSQLAEFYCFLSLQGFKRMHLCFYRFYCDLYEKAGMYYIDEHGMMPTERRTENVDVIPTAWRGMNRIGIEPDGRKNAFTAAIREWCDIENDMHEKLVRSAYRLRDANEICSALWVEKILKEQHKIAKKAYRLLSKLEGSGWLWCCIEREDDKLHTKGEKAWTTWK